jgi:dihydropteroate synthase
MKLNQIEFKLPETQIMGILNLTPDSFSDGGKWNSAEKALKRAKILIEQGADILDLGAESTRPGSLPVNETEELERILPVLDQLKKDIVPISIDTNKISVQKTVLQHGAHIINDIMGGSEELFSLAEEFQAGLVLMHTSAAPSIMQEHTEYEDIFENICSYFLDRLKILKKYKIPHVWIDPGIGFGKTPEQNLLLMKEIQRFQFPGCTLFLGSSRKSWINHLYQVPPERRTGASIGSVLACYTKGVRTFRVHDVEETSQALKTYILLQG